MKNTYPMYCSPCKEHGLNGNRLIKPEDIIYETSHYLGVPIKAVLGRSRNRNLVESRFIMYHLIRYNPHFKFSLFEIGKMFRKDHTTIIHGLEKCRTYYQVDDKFRKRLEGSHIFIYGNLNYLVI